MQNKTARSWDNLKESVSLRTVRAIGYFSIRFLPSSSSTSAVAENSQDVNEHVDNCKDQEHSIFLSGKYFKKILKTLLL
jgi:hypothetical protein